MTTRPKPAPSSSSASSASAGEAVARADPAASDRRMADEERFRARVGHKFNLSGDWGGVLDCEVLAVEPNTDAVLHLGYAHEDPQFDLHSVVTFTLTPTAAGTHLRMDRPASAPTGQAYGGAKAGWQHSSASSNRCWRKAESGEDAMTWNGLDPEGPPLAVDRPHPGGDRQHDRPGA